MSNTRGIYLLQQRHAAAIQELASDAAIAATTRIPHPYPENGAATFLEIVEQQRQEGIGYGFAIEDGGRLVGVCGLHDFSNPTTADLGYWVGRPFWGKGYATFAVKMLLEFAFHQLRLETVRAIVLQDNIASRRVVEKNGFRAVRVEPNSDPALKVGSAPVVIHEITAQAWQEFRDRPALDKLHPELMALVQRELAAGNEIVETGQGWPEPDSVFVRLRHPFTTRATEVPPTVTYQELNDPHWWKAEYSTQIPRHIVAY